MSTENCKFRIPLMTYIKLQHTDDSIDCADTEIDALIGIETDIYHDEEFPNLYEATCLFYNLVDVVCLNPVIIDMYGLFHHNYDVIREWVKEAWKPDYAELLETDDSGEWEYQLIECINQLISGNVGEITAARYVKLFKQFQRVPAKADEMVLSEAGLTLPKDILGLWEQTICEIRSEIKSWDLIGPHTKQYAKELCDKLEHSMCALAGGSYNLRYSIGD